MSKKNKIIAYVVGLLILIVVVLGLWTSLNKRQQTASQSSAYKNLTADEILQALDQDNQKKEEEMKKIISETDFDPNKATPQEVVEKLNKFEEYFSKIK